MARRYSRDGQGRFASKSSKGDAAETIQQNKAKKDSERRSKKEELSGNKVGFGKGRRRVKRTAGAGNRATTKAMENSTARAKDRFK